MSGRQIGSAVGFVIGAMAGGNWQLGMMIGSPIGECIEPDQIADRQEDGDESRTSLD